MTQHELHCTMNPKRKCRMCKLMGLETKPMEELKAIFPQEIIAKITETDNCIFPNLILSQDECERISAPYLKGLHDATDNCPACILSTLRQLGVHPRSIGYDYQEEVKSFWYEYNWHQEYEREEHDNFYPY